jgi:LacI family transcriptional regulator
VAVTRADVAALAGVSPALVSYVVNGGPRPVSAQARSRIEAAIEALGYRPNAIASALRAGMTRTIGLLTSSPVNPYFAELAEALGRELSDRGNALSIAVTDGDPQREALLVRSHLDRRVDGLIVASAEAALTVQGMQAEPVPVVAVDRVDVGARVTSVTIDNAEAGRVATEHLQGHGHRLIGCVTGPRPLTVSSMRVAGWRDQQQAAGAPAGDAVVAYAPFSMEGGREAASELLDLRVSADGSDRPTALVVASDVQALGVLAACAELGLRVPDDIAVASIDGTKVGRFLQPPLTTVRQPITEIAHAAVEMLLRRIAEPDLPQEHVELTGNLVVGRSCGCRPLDVA